MKSTQFHKLSYYLLILTLLSSIFFILPERISNNQEDFDIPSETTHNFYQPELIPIFANNNGTTPIYNHTDPTITTTTDKPIDNNDKTPDKSANSSSNTSTNPINPHYQWQTSENITSDIQQKNARDIEITQTQNQIQINSVLHDSSAESDEIEIKIQYPTNSIDILIQHFADSPKNSPKVSFHIKIHQLIEYIDENNDLTLDDNDQIIQEMNLDGLYLSNYSEIQLNENYSLYYFEINSSSNIFSMHFFISETFFELEETTITPSQLKFDFEIVNFPFLQEISRLALQIQAVGNQQVQQRIEHKEKTEDETLGFSSNESSIVMNEGENQAYLSWANFVMVDGIYQTVTFGEGISTAQGQSYYINYPQGTNIFHDPKLGISNLLNLEPTIPTLPPDWNLSTILIIIASIVIALFGLMMSKQEYRSYLLNRVLPLNTAPHRLSMKEVLENETRMEILNEIIDDPGIHYSKLLDNIKTSPSNLAWHLDILQTYRIIQKQRIGNYLIFYPYLDKNPFANINPTLVKSKTTMEIFKLIGDNPGIHVNKLAQRLDLHRKTIKYHLDKLNNANIVIMLKDGRKNTYSINPEIIDDLID